MIEIMPKEMFNAKKKVSRNDVVFENIYALILL